MNDVSLVKSSFGLFDVNLHNKDLVKVEDHETLSNAVILSILTQYLELQDIPLYEDFGCRIHELIKQNTSKLTTFKIEDYIRNSLEKVRRISTVDEVLVEIMGNQVFIKVQVTDIEDYSLELEL